MKIITAGAGTGKTTRLTQIIRDGILEGRYQPHAIIGTTFTNKAADELVQRVRQSLFGTGRIDLAERLGESLLGTVDSVCARLLGRFAFEAGISPKIALILEQDADLLLSQSIEEACGFAQIQEIRAISDRLGQIDDVGKYQWTHWVDQIATKARDNLIDATALPAMGKRSADELLAVFPVPAASHKELECRLCRAIESTISAIRANGDKTDVTSKYINLLVAALRGLRNGRLPWSEWIKLTKAKIAKKSAGLAEPVSRAAQQYPSHPRLHADIRRFTDLIFEIASAALDIYQERKEERGLLDFVDLEQRALKLLQRDDVASAIREEFDLLIVDEFQDTNPIQLALFMRLAELVRSGIARRRWGGCFSVRTRICWRRQPTGSEVGAPLQA